MNNLEALSLSAVVKRVLVAGSSIIDVTANVGVTSNHS